MVTFFSRKESRLFVAKGIFCSLFLALLASWIQSCLQRALDELAAHPQPFSYEELTAPLADAVRHPLQVTAESGHPARTLSVLASPPSTSGKTVLLVHAFKMSGSTWAPVWNELRVRGHRVLALDLPGHGQSTFSEAALNLSSLSADIRYVLDHFEVDDGVLVGHSLGGFLAIQYLLEHPAHSAQRVPFGFACVACTAGHWQHFIGGAGNWHGKLLMASGLFDLLMQSNSIAPLLMAKKFGEPSLPAVQVVVEASRVGAGRASLKSLSDLTWEHNLHPMLSSIHVPSVVVVGSLDDHHPHPVMSEALQKDFAASGLLRAYVVLDGVGHFIPLMRPFKTVEAIERLWLG